MIDYDKLIPLPVEELEAPDKQDEIHEIDARGVKSTKEIARFLGDEYRLPYYSEGMRKFIEDGIL